ncbi:MAG: hypothetical protein HQK49_11565 [Oligoflexia bacterium]|nr:hypothetical protein [Oligoflexia bacterium]
MKKLLLLFLLIIITTTLNINNTFATKFTIRAPQGVIPERCSEDSLSAEESIERLHWANRCGYLTARYLDFCLNDDNGSVRARPMYPSFISSDFSKAWVQAPKNRNSECIIPDAFKVVQPIFCISSCYTPDQKILFASNKNISIIDAYNSNFPTVMVAKDSSTIGNILLEEIPIKFFTKEAIDTNNQIIKFTTESTKTIKVTSNHPLIDGDGYLKEANNFKISDYLLNEHGQKEKIIDISHFNHFGKVYNILPESKNISNHILVAGGLLSGSAYFQNDGVIYLNRKLLRDGGQYDDMIPSRNETFSLKNLYYKNYLLWNKLTSKVILTTDELNDYQQLSNDPQLINFILKNLNIHSNHQQFKMSLVDSIFTLLHNPRTKTNKNIKKLIIEELTKLITFKRANKHFLTSDEKFELIELNQILNYNKEKKFMGVINWK